MDDRLPDIIGSNIVMVGHFNPAIFQPWWFARHGLVDDREAEDAEVVITDAFTSVQFDWFAIEAFRERVTVTTLPDTPTARPVRDMAMAIFSFLPHTPITAIGMNHNGHLWLAESGWSKLVSALAETSVHLLSGDESLMRLALQAEREDDLDGYRQLTVEPSGRIRGGAWLSLNSHVALDEAPGRLGAETAVAILDEFWEASADDANRVFDSVRQVAARS